MSKLTCGLQREKSIEDSQQCQLAITYIGKQIKFKIGLKLRLLFLKIYFLMNSIKIIL